MNKRQPKVHINVRLPAPIIAFITKHARQHNQDFTAALTDILTSAIAGKSHAA